ncbi:unnamed protein product [Caenorhabditis nigoni]
MRGGYQVVHQDKRHVAKPTKEIESRQFSIVFNVLAKPRRYECLPKLPPTVARCRIRPTMPTKSAYCVIP